MGGITEECSLTTRSVLTKLGIQIVNLLRRKENSSDNLMTLFATPLDTQKFLEFLLIGAKDFELGQLNETETIDALLWLYKKAHKQAPTKLRGTFFRNKEYTKLINRLADKNITITSPTLSR